MSKMHYTVEWVKENPWGDTCVDRKRFETNEDATGFISQLSCHEGVKKIWKISVEEITIKG